MLKKRLDEIGADSLGLKAFVGPQQDRILVSELLDALEADLKLRQVRSLDRLQSHLKRVRGAFGDRRAIDIRTETVDRYIESRLSEKEAPAETWSGRASLSEWQCPFQATKRGRYLTATTSSRRTISGKAVERTQAYLKAVPKQDNVKAFPEGKPEAKEVAVS